MEQIQIFDSINNKNVNVFVAQEIAEKCRLDANFAAELVRQIEEQNVEEGSTIEIETIADIQSSSSDALIEKELWTRKESMKFLKLYQKYGNKYVNYKKALWVIISKELANRNILKPPDRCKSKWKNLIRTYNAAQKRNNTYRFQYYKAVDDIMNGKPLILSDSDSEVESCDENLILNNLAHEKTKSKEYMEKETWSRYETVQFLKLYQKYKNTENKIGSKEALWTIISNDLNATGIFKSAEKCATKFKNLFRTYKKNLEKESGIPTQRFKYFKEMDDLMHDREIIPSEVLSDTAEESECFESGDFEEYPENSTTECEIKEQLEDNKINMSTELKWSEDEISKLLWVHNKSKKDFESVENKENFWQLISKELESIGIYRNPEACENEWNSIQTRYSIGEQFDATDNIIIVGGDSIDNLDRDKLDDDVQYVKIIVENENGDIESNNENNRENSWTDNEIATLITSCVKQIENNKSKEIDNSTWESISVNLDSSDVPKSADECKRKWEDLLSTYETCKKLNLECENFLVFDKIEEILLQNKTNDHQNVNTIRTTNCNCIERRLEEKQKRHTERMQILKRKLDIEERKVKAFEEYVKYIKR